MAATSNETFIREKYIESLSTLKDSNDAKIVMLTILAEHNRGSAVSIIRGIEQHIRKVTPEMKLPVLRLVDSILKKVGGVYKTLLTQNIITLFYNVYEEVEESTRASMYELRQTWSDIFSNNILYALDVLINSINHHWPITASNPSFLQQSSSAQATNPGANDVIMPIPSSDLSEIEMRESLKVQKELLELQQNKLKIELLQTKARFQQQQIHLAQTVRELRQLETRTRQQEICVPQPMEEEIFISQTPVRSPPATSSSSQVPGEKSDSGNEKIDQDKEKDKDRDRETDRKRPRVDSGEEDELEELSHSFEGREQQQLPSQETTLYQGHVEILYSRLEASGLLNANAFEIQRLVRLARIAGPEPPADMNRDN